MNRTFKWGRQGNRRKNRRSGLGVGTGPGMNIDVTYGDESSQAEEMLTRRMLPYEIQRGGT